MESKDKNEFVESIKKAVRERISSPLYGTFLIAWLLFNWKVAYLTIFVDGEILLELGQVNKLDYILSLYEFSNFKYIALSIFQLAIGPAISVFLYFWVLSHVADRIIKKDRSIKNRRRISEIKEEEEVKEAELSLLNVKGDVQEKSSEVQKLSSKEWEKEYQEIKKTKHFQHDFWAIKEVLLSYQGNIYALQEIFGEGEAEKIMRDYVFLLISKGILTQRENTISLTEKGTYIMGRYIEEIQVDGAEKHNFKIGMPLNKH